MITIGRYVSPYYLRFVIRSKANVPESRLMMASIVRIFMEKATEQLGRSLPL